MPSPRRCRSGWILGGQNPEGHPPTSRSGEPVYENTGRDGPEGKDCRLAPSGGPHRIEPHPFNHGGEAAARAKSTGEEFKTFAVTDESDPRGKRYIIELKSITARDRWIVDEDPYSGTVSRAERKPSGFEKLIEPKDEHLGQTMMYSYLVTQEDFGHERLGGKPLTTPPDVMIIYQAKDIDPKYYGKNPHDYPSGNDLLNSPFKIFTVPYDQRRVDANLAKLADVWGYIDRGELPPRDHKHIPSRPAWACVDCAFRKDCYAKEGYFNDAEENEPARVDYLRRQLERRHEKPEAEPQPALEAGAGA